MIRIDYLLFGYRRFTVDFEDIAKTAEIFLKFGISVKFVGNSFFADIKKSKIIEKVLLGNVKFQKSELLGFYGFVLNNRKRFGIFFAILLTVFMFAVTKDKVWDIRIEGSQNGNEDKIISDLNECGFKVGTSWSKIDMSHIEVDFLSKSEDVSWININRRGTVAYVTVIDKSAYTEPDDNIGYSNVVSKYDGVIEEITVKRGIAMVKAGDTVKKGDLLISGVIPEELGGGFCYAEGIIRGRISDSIEVSVPNFKEEKISGKKKLSLMSVKILGFSVNIFKSYRNSDGKCDIIEEKRTFSFLGKDIPLVVNKKYTVGYTLERTELTEDEMTKIALSEMINAINVKLKDSNLIRISTNGKFEDSSYTMKTDMVYSCQIGKNISFNVQNS